MKIRILFLLVAVMAFAACQKTTTNETLPSGYEYVLHTPNNDGAKAEAEALAFFRYGMRNDEGVVVSNYDATFPQAAPIPSATPGRPLTPIDEALMLMRIGDSLTIIVPLDTVPAAERPQGFENSSFLYYDISLKDMKTQATLQARVGEVDQFMSGTIDAYSSGSLENIQTTESGLKYVIHEEGTGEKPDSADYVYVDYYGSLLNKSTFDDSFKRGMPFAFQIQTGRVIPGWDEGIALLPEGSKATLFVPSDLGYGEAGSPPVIPGGAELVFYVELISVLSPE
jgi:FKBP-type peptidyl-prolyl cis-trans isomerase FkpA